MDTRPFPALAIDDCLSVRGGHLWIEGCDTVELVRRFGSPIHVESEDQLRRNVRRIDAAFTAAWPEGEVQLLPSIKANFTLALRRILTDEGTGCDTFGPGELEAALRCGVPPGMISVNGSVKSPDLIATAVDAGCRITLDSVREIGLVRDAARRVGTRAIVRFRLRPDYDDLDVFTEFSDEDVPIREAAAAYKPGIPTEDLERFGREAIDAPELDVAGVMAHLGRHHHAVEVWRSMGSSLAETIGRLARAWGGWTPREIDVGGGFASPRDPTGRATRRGADRPFDERSPTIEAYAEAIASSLRDGLSRAGVATAGMRLEVEPGRVLFADTGIHLTRVRNLKAQSRPIAHRWIETDTTEMFLPDGLIEHNRWTVIAADHADQPPGQVADLVGMSCGFDVIVHDADLPEVEPGDVIAVLDTGAYQDAASSNFNALPRPAMVLVHGEDAEIVKLAESVDDVFRRDIVPARLERSSRMTILGLDHVSVTTADIVRSLAFYRDLLEIPVKAVGELSGTEVEQITGVTGARMLTADLDLGNGQVLELIEYLDGTAGTALPLDHAGSGHIGLAVRDVDTLYRHLADAGIDVTSEPTTVTDPGDWCGARCMTVRDPDGIAVELVERPLRSSDSEPEASTGTELEERRLLDVEPNAPSE